MKDQISQSLHVSSNKECLEEVYSRKQLYRLGDLSVVLSTRAFFSLSASLYIITGQMYLVSMAVRLLLVFILCMTFHGFYEFPVLRYIGLENGSVTLCPNKRVLFGI